MNILKSLRAEKKLTQQQAAELLGISLRSYKTYENDETKKNTLKYQYILERLQQHNPLDETHGLLTVDDIKERTGTIFAQYCVRYSILFGSYAKGTAGESSDVDLLVVSDVTGLRFYGMVEELRAALRKKVDVLTLDQLKNNMELTSDILEDGIRIYGQCKE
ncbi:MAG: nucleotidyltransferase domain-containing protein [Lachnospiraceae bacterium]|nr:nucleotidyltransferase domain-containing protein [Lachnospiraceae bacterium]